MTREQITQTTGGRRGVGTPPAQGLVGERLTAAPARVVLSTLARTGLDDLDDQVSAYRGMCSAEYT
ncbi:hypothetical protein [Kitasatospora sp. NPDC057015]|uniref:hypothetical protein n=1 Tax=Kitasatospora sp. NPDC057015 TaxID=3346001 RepID=UPI003633140A